MAGEAPVPHFHECSMCSLEHECWEEFCDYYFDKEQDYVCPECELDE